LRGTLLALLLAAAQDPPLPPTPEAREVAGRYRLSGQPDEVAQLELRPDGRFRFALIAGALDARAEGRWRRESDAVLLNTEPRPVAPAFRADRVKRVSGVPVEIVVNAPTGEGVALIDVRVGFADGRILEGYTQDNGWRPAAGGDRGLAAPAWVELSNLPFGIPLQRFPLDATRGNRFVFILQPNDFGVLDFRDERAAIVPEGLRLGGSLFVREN
jgi:hypothetical protein